MKTKRWIHEATVGKPCVDDQGRSYEITFSNGSVSRRNGKFLKLLPDPRQDHSTPDNMENGTTLGPVPSQPAEEEVEPWPGKQEQKPIKKQSKN